MNGAIPIMGGKTTAETVIRQIDAMKGNIQSIAVVAVMKDGGVRPLISDQPPERLSICAHVLQSIVLGQLQPKPAQSVPYQAMNQQSRKQ